MPNQMKSVSDRKPPFRPQDLVFAGILLAAACFLFWKCPYGYGNIDEAFYLTVPYRLAQGDALLEEEWHLSQMAGVLTLPFVSIYTAFKGTEGILLAMRYFCTFLQCLTAVFLYVRLKPMSWAGAVVASVSFVLYIPFGIMALSYNSMGIMALLISLVIALTAQRRKKPQYLLSGLFFAAAVLCCPYLLLVYLLYLAAAAVSALYRRKKALAQSDSILSAAGAAWFTLGAGLAALAFAVFVLSRGSLTNILRSLPSILNDPEHADTSLAWKTKVFFTSILDANSWSAYIYAAFALIAAVCLLDKKRAARRSVYALLAALCTLALMYSHYRLNHYINHLMWSVNILALFLFFLSDDPNIRKLFFCLWIPGILYAFCLNLSSNQCFYAISSASAVSAVGSLMIVVLFTRDLIRSHQGLLRRMACGGTLCLLLAAQLLSQGILRYQSVFWEYGGMDSLTAYISDGINAGIYASPDKYERYYDQLYCLSVLDQYDGQPVLYLSENTWYYLVGNHPMATFSAWTSGVNEHTLARLEAYYAINPEKFPDVVFADGNYRDTAEQFCQMFGFVLEETPGGFLLTPNSAAASGR